MGLTKQEVSLMLWAIGILNVIIGVVNLYTRSNDIWGTEKI